MKEEKYFLSLLPFLPSKLAQCSGRNPAKEKEGERDANAKASENAAVGCPAIHPSSSYKLVPMPMPLSFPMPPPPPQKSLLAPEQKLMQSPQIFVPHFCASYFTLLFLLTKCPRKRNEPPGIIFLFRCPFDRQLGFGAVRPRRPCVPRGGSVKRQTNAPEADNWGHRKQLS
jgi:hypothetical protein